MAIKSDPDIFASIDDDPYHVATQATLFLISVLEHLKTLAVDPKYTAALIRHVQTIKAQEPELHGIIRHLESEERALHSGGNIIVLPRRES